MILVDTSVWIDFFNGKNNDKVFLLEKYLKTDRIITGDIIKIELFQGFKSDRDYEIAKMLFAKLEYSNMLTESTIEKCIEIYRFLRKNGITIRKTIDTIIAAFCIDSNLKLLHNDNDFNNIAKYFPLQVVKN